MGKTCLFTKKWAYSMKTIKNVEFKLTNQEIELSKRLFNGKIIRVIIHNGCNEQTFNESKSDSFKFMPEQRLSFKDTLSYIKNVSQLKDHVGTILIITNSLSIITSVPKVLCRVLEKKGESIVLKKMKNETFGQNTIDVAMDLSDNKSIPSTAVDFFETLIDKIEKGKWKTSETIKKSIINDIELCGDSLIYFQLYKLIGMEKRRDY